MFYMKVMGGTVGPSMGHSGGHRKVNGPPREMPKCCIHLLCIYVATNSLENLILDEMPLMTSPFQYWVLSVMYLYIYGSD